MTISNNIQPRKSHKIKPLKSELRYTVDRNNAITYIIIMNSRFSTNFRN